MYRTDLCLNSSSAFTSYVTLDIIYLRFFICKIGITVCDGVAERAAVHQRFLILSYGAEELLLGAVQFRPSSCIWECISD